MKRSARNALGLTALSTTIALLGGCSSSDKAGKVVAPEKEAGAALAPYPAPAPDTCLTSVAAGKQSLTCDGLDFDIDVPAQCLTKACGFITDVHGFGMNAAIMEGHTHMQELGEANGYIVLQPSAPGQILTSVWSRQNDGQVFALMKHVIDVWHPDAKRIHFDGYSMGAWMTWRFVCAHSDVLASAAPIAGGLDPMGSCAFSEADGGTPVRKIPVLYTHGRNDGLVNFAEAIAERDAITAAWFPGVAPTVVAQASDYEWDRYTSADGNVFEFVQHDWECGFALGPIALKGHCFPGSNNFLGCGRHIKDAEGADGGIQYPFDWAPTVMKFFVAHPMK